MLRTMLLNHTGLILLIVSQPIATAAAGPIFTHAAVPGVTMPWGQGANSSNPFVDSPGVSSSGVPAGLRWVDVQSGRGGLLSRDPVTNGNGISQASTSGSAGGPLPAQTATTPSVVNDLPGASAAATEALSSPAPAPSPASPIASSQATTRFVPEMPNPSGTDLSGRGGESSITAAGPGARSNGNLVAGPASSSPSPTNPTGQGSGPASSYPSS